MKSGEIWKFVGLDKLYPRAVYIVVDDCVSADGVYLVLAAAEDVRVDLYRKNKLYSVPENMDYWIKVNLREVIYGV